MLYTPYTMPGVCAGAGAGQNIRCASKLTSPSLTRNPETLKVNYTLRVEPGFPLPMMIKQATNKAICSTGPTSLPPPSHLPPACPLPYRTPPPLSATARKGDEVTWRLLYISKR